MTSVPTFALHEDDVNMIELLPAENAPARQAELEAAARHGEQHRVPGLMGWTGIHLVSEAPVPLTVRRLPLSQLREWVSPVLPPAERLTTGYGGKFDLETVPRGFAFGRPYGPPGGLYGQEQGGVVASLALISHLGVPVFAELLHDLGQRLDLILVDWWKDRLISLRDRPALERYLNGDDDTDD